jgi:hypothetical protein
MLWSCFNIDKIHHLINKNSILEDLNIGMNTQIPLDPMHTIDESAVAKFLYLFENKRRLLKRHKKIMSTLMKHLSWRKKLSQKNSIVKLEHLRFWKVFNFCWTNSFVGFQRPRKK